MALPDGGMEKIVVLLRFNIVDLEPPEYRLCGFTSILELVTSSVLTVKELVQGEELFQTIPE